MDANIGVVLAEDKTLAYGRCMTFTDYCRLQTDRGRLLQMRYAETRLAPTLQASMVEYGDALAVVALVIDGDPDMIAVLPVIARLLSVSGRVQLRVLTDADMRPLAVLLPDVDLAASLEEVDLPQFFIFDEEWELQAQWGPRPAQAERNLLEWFSRYPEYETLADDESAAAQDRYAALTTVLIHEMRIWYNSSLAEACEREFYDVLAALLSDETNEGES
jgi:hypothetical protein